MPRVTPPSHYFSLYASRNTPAAPRNAFGIRIYPSLLLLARSLSDDDDERHFPSLLLYTFAFFVALRRTRAHSPYYYYILSSDVCLCVCVCATPSSTLTRRGHTEALLTIPKYQIAQRFNCLLFFFYFTSLAPGYTIHAPFFPNVTLYDEQRAVKKTRHKRPFCRYYHTHILVKKKEKKREIKVSTMMVQIVHFIIHRCRTEFQLIIEKKG